jgi:HEAT repeat protein/AAA+ ATPase superfamily predicted ATPase/energy-coupling factor transporter ATP-binding protein EcfA2
VTEAATPSSGRRPGRPSSGRLWQLASHWSEYQGYLQELEQRLDRASLPGLGAVRLEDTYVPLQLHLWRNPDRRDGLTPRNTSVGNSLEQALAEHPQVLVIGPAGTGKSALLRHLGLLTARKIQQAGRRGLVTGGTPPLPIYLNVSDLDASVSLAAAAAASMRAGGFNRPEAFLDAHLVEGSCLLLLDGLDELVPEARGAAVGRVRDLVARHPGNLVVVASRDPADRMGLPDFQALEVGGVEAASIDTLAGRWGQGQRAAATGFLQVLERFALVRDLVSHPGWLATTLAAVAHAEAPVRAIDIVRGFIQQLDPGDTRPWPAIALDLYRAEAIDGSIDMVPTERRGSGLLQWLTEDRFRFVHKAVQACFAAEALADDTEELLRLAADPWWHPVIVLAVGHRRDAGDLIRRLLELDDISLAARAIAEARPMPADLVETIQVALLGELGHGVRERDRTLAISLAGLRGGDTIRRSGLVSPVLSALGDPRPVVRREAAAAAGRLGDASAIASLLSSLGDPDPEVQAASSKALATFGERTIQPLLRQLSLPDESLRRAAMLALARHGGRAVTALVPLLDTGSAAVRQEAVEALALIGAEAVPALVKVLEEAPPRGSRSENQVAGAAAALTKIGRPAVRPLVPLYGDAEAAVAREIAEIVRAIGGQAITVLGEVLAEPDHPHAVPAAALLGSFGDAGDLAAPPLVQALGDPRFNLRWEAKRSLRRLGQSGLTALLEALQHPDGNLRWEAAQLLLALPDPPVEPLLVSFQSDLASEDMTIRRRAIRALGGLNAPAARQLIEDALGDPDALIRRAAVAQLGISGTAESVTALLARWPQEEDEETAETILQVAADLDPQIAVPTLIEALASEDSHLRRTATDLLSQVGEPAVIPLVEALSSRPTEIDFNGALKVLERAGQGARAGGRAPANLARAFHRMLVEPLDAAELAEMAAGLDWWKPSVELHQTFRTLRQFLSYESLGGIGGAETALDWVDEIDPWLRPAARRAMRQLRMISQAVQYYNRGATRRSKEKGLLAAADRLNSLRAMIGEVGEPHGRLLRLVAEHWNGLINQAIRELQGRADLDLDMRTDQVRIRDVDTAAVLVFDLFNKGEGLASNVQLSLSVDEESMQLESQSTHYLPPLGQGDRISSEFTVLRRGAGVAPVSVEVRYDDPQREAQSRLFQREVRFYVEEAEYREIGTSPYIAGPPVKSREMFYGRKSVFDWIRENLSGTFQDNVLVLYGERRTGKTSVLYQMQHHLPETYAFVLIDLQTIAYGLSSTGELLHAMARKVVNGLRKEGFDLERVDRADYEAHPIEQFEALGETIGDMAVAIGRRAVIILDEFDLLIEAIDRGSVSPFVFDVIRGLMQHQDGLSFIFAGAHALTAMIKNPRSILFNTALRRKISFLERDEAERLIRDPVKNVLWYDDLAVEKILRVTAGQPYFIQYICHEIVNLARRDQKNFVTLRDVDRALLTTVQETTGIIRHSYMSLLRDEQLALAALARITDDGRPFVNAEDVVETLRQDNVTVGVHDLSETMHELAGRDFVVERGGGDSAGRQYGFAMDLVRVWLEQNDEYTRLLEEQRG